MKKLLSQLSESIVTNDDYPNPSLFIEVNLSWNVTEIRDKITSLLKSEKIQSRYERMQNGLWAREQGTCKMEGFRR